MENNAPLYAFCALVVVILTAIGYFMRSALTSISTQAGVHAKRYSIAYIKGACLMFIGAGVTFDQAFYALNDAVQATMPWAPYVIFFWKPMAAAATVLVGFLDRSSQTATAEAKADAGQTTL